MSAPETAKLMPLRRQSSPEAIAKNEPNIAETSNSIAMLAYTLWENRGCPEGSPEKDWFEAERKIREQEISR